VTMAACRRVLSKASMLVAVQDGEVVDRLEGANAPELAHKVASPPSQRPTQLRDRAAAWERPPQPAEVINNLQSTLHAPLRPRFKRHTHCSAHKRVPCPRPAPASGLTPELKARLEKLVASEPVLLFMKENPRGAPLRVLL